MRPVRLEAEGFTCYRERQEPLDFSSLSLFAIAGPTGAGKSSILDTMLYALYGEVPRIGKQGIGEFIAHGRDAMSVCLDFAVRGSSYRVTRRVKRGKKNLNTVATLAELVAGGERSLADGVKPVNEAIERLLGLDFNAFTQTVILPQGDFAKFLRADPKDQRSILQHLLRHEVFERMRIEAERRRAESDRDAHGVEGQLTAFEHATPEALIAVQEKLVGARVTLEASNAEKVSQEAALEELRERHRLTVEVQGLRSSRTRLDKVAPKIAAKRDELAAARRAAEIVPRLEAAAAADSRLGQAVRERDAAAAELSARNAALSAADQRAKAATANAESIVDLTLRIRALDEIKGDLTRREAIRAALDALTRDLPVAQRLSDKAGKRVAKARTDKVSAGSTVVSASAALENSGFNAAEQHRLDEVWTTAVQVRAADDELARLTDSHGSLERAVERAAVALQTAEETYAAATQAVDAALIADHLAVSALDQGRTKHQSAAVREHLHVGETCPVCLQTVSEMPTVETVPELDALSAARDQAKERLGAAQKKLQGAAEKRAGARAGVDGANQSHDASLRLRRQKSDERAALYLTLAEAFAGASLHAAGVDLLTAIEARRGELRAAKQAHDRAVEQLRVAEASASLADLALVRAESDLRAAVDEQQRLEAQQASLRAEYDALVARIVAVSTHDDPATEREALALKVQALESAVRAAQDARAELFTQVASTTARHTSALATVHQAHAAFTAATNTRDLAIRDGGFAGIDAVQAAVRPAAVQRDLDDAVRTHDSEFAAVMTRLLELEPKISGKEVSAETVAEADAQRKATFDAWRQADLAVSSLTASRQQLEADGATRVKLLEKLLKLRKHLTLHAGMAADLRGDAFQEYLLEEAFHSLVAGASVRMRQMSNRYTLEWDDSDFFVVDHDNAGERRRAETLSGGETFMASLCLALQLSDEVLKTSGALQMDSLFIDEGFGTLDSESLAEVTDAMESLRQDGARLIGVISHRPELTERLPGCIKVTKGAGESSWQLERVG